MIDIKLFQFLEVLVEIVDFFNLIMREFQNVYLWYFGFKGKFLNICKFIMTDI